MLRWGKHVGEFGALKHFSLSEVVRYELVRLGLARFNDYGNPHQYTGRIEAAAITAEAAGVGLWGICPAQ